MKTTLSIDSNIPLKVFRAYPFKLFLLTQTENDWDDTHDSCLVCASSPEDAKSITPENLVFVENETKRWAFTKAGITCTEIGTANENQVRGCLIASFNAG